MVVVVAVDVRCYVIYGGGVVDGVVRRKESATRASMTVAACTNLVLAFLSVAFLSTQPALGLMVGADGCGGRAEVFGEVERPVVPVLHLGNTRGGKEDQSISSHFFVFSSFFVFFRFIFYASRALMHLLYTLSNYESYSSMCLVSVLRKLLSK